MGLGGKGSRGEYYKGHEKNTYSGGRKGGLDGEGRLGEVTESIHRYR